MFNDNFNVVLKRNVLKSLKYILFFSNKKSQKLFLAFIEIANVILSMNWSSENPKRHIFEISHCCVAFLNLNEFSQNFSSNLCVFKRNATPDSLIC